MADTKRRARGEDSIFFAPSRNCWVGEITVGWKPDGRRDRITVRGKTKTEVKDKLKAKHQELDASVRTPAHYTIQQCIEDWLDSLSTQSPATLTNYRNAAGHVIELIGSIKLADLKARDVELALTSLARRKSTRSVRLYRMVLVRAVRHAQVNDLAMRNVAELISVPAGQPGRPSKALTLEQALALLEAAKTHRLWAYVAVILLVGLRTEEARALRWSEVDLEAGTVAVYRSVRLGGDTKTEKSRRFVQLPDIAVEALRALVLAQAADRAKAGTAWVENNLVFCRRTGTPLTDHDVWLQFTRITEKAGLGTDWSPRELRHTFVSLLSDSGVPIEQIADAVGHASTWTTENVYRHQLRPVLRTAATVLGPLFVGQENGSPSENLACHLGCLSLSRYLAKEL
jgi:integrase